MIFDVRHVSTYRYEASVASARCVIRLLPRAGDGQRVLRSAIHAEPAFHSMHERTDFFGNRVVEASIRDPHSQLRISLRARVEVLRDAPPDAAHTPAWERVCTTAVASQSLAWNSPVHFVFPSRLAPRHEGATRYARESFGAGRPVLEGAAELMRRIRADFTYDPEATHVATPLAEAFEARGGVCQDFAHVMIAGLRGLGVPAAYVSGYIRTIPAPGQPLLEGIDGSHAWVATWTGEETGWVHLDPTNAMLVGDEHIVVAIGRDYADVAPIDGVIVGSGRQDLDVRVGIRAVE